MSATDARWPVSPSLARNPRIADWIRVEPDGTYTVLTGKVELGQGIHAALARIAAEELGVPLDRVRVAHADTATAPVELPTVGSRSLLESGMAVRLAAAAARRREDLGDALVGEPVTVPPDEHAIVGQPGVRPDLLAIVTGTTRYVADLAEPGTLHARVVRPPSPGARLRAVDLDAVRALAGVVEVVHAGGFLGVIAESGAEAARAAEVLAARARWEERATLTPSHGIHAWLRAQPAQSYRVVDGEGVEGVEPAPDATPTVRATYTRPYVMHGSIGPSAAMAEWRGDALTVWSHTQAIFEVREVLASWFGVEEVRVQHVVGSGCYGHNGADDAAYDAALLARAVPGRRVLLTWSRADEHAWEPYGPPAVIDAEATLDADGRIVDWRFEVWSDRHGSRSRATPQADRPLALQLAEPDLPAPAWSPQLGGETAIHRNAEPLYDLPEKRIVVHAVRGPVRTSSLRSLGAHANVFAIESLMDELALAAGADPLELRLRHLGDPRARAVLEAAAERAGWGRAPGMGLAISRYKNSAAYAAVVVEVAVDDATARIRLQRATIAADAGEIVDPDGLVNQLEGGFVQAASWALCEQVTFDDTRVTSADWDGYPILRFPDVPEIDVVLLDRPGEPYLGAGEATTPPTPAAIANAVFAAVGVRLRHLPFAPEAVRRAAEEA